VAGAAAGRLLALRWLAGSGGGDGGGPGPGALGAALGFLVACLAIGLALGFGSVLSGDEQACGTTVSPHGQREIPARLLPIYDSAANRYRLGPDGPAYLAAINEHETSFGANLSTSSAGALGWMQFMPGTWAAYGVDADGDGRRDPASPWDAIFAAARYLRANGAPGDWDRALLAYNHAGWYVRLVNATAGRYRGAADCAPAGLRGRIVEIAQSQLGVAERPPGSNCTPYGPCDQWCAMFTTWVWARAGIHDVRISSNYSVPNLRDWARRRALWKPGAHNDPQPGDMAVFPGHVSLVERVVSGGRIVTINGNGVDARVARRGPSDPATMPPGGVLGYIVSPGEQIAA
jgi:Transglycosylase SLT domain/CHAP domain